MATQQTAVIFITNNTDGPASIVLFHSNSSNGTQSGRWDVGPGGTAGPLVVHFETGIGTGGILDYWSVLLHVTGGSTPGLYVSSGTPGDAYWKECQLQHADASQNITLSVDTSTFNVSLKSGGCKGGMTKLTPGANPVSHVFVLMLENHSFDNVFAMSGISGITAATSADSNSYNGQTYSVQTSAPLSMPTDPGHEFDDVVEQLAGAGATYSSGSPYPPINNSGFAANYATSTSEAPHKPPPPQDIVDIMACFNTQTQLPVTYQLATQFAICDHWYSSIPGPTWPNRFFLHGASSSGMDDSPSTGQMIGWEAPGGGFQYPHGSIYDRLRSASIPYRFYNDALPGSFHSLYSDDPQNGSSFGAIPQVTALQGVTLLDVNSMQHFATDLQGPYPFPYTFIEPNYGDVTGGTYAGGSSQHPMDDMYGGEHLLSAVYQAIRNSPYWESSLLIVIYDEHGGFYDSVAPPSAPTPGDNPNYGYNTHGFNFTNFGVRVPAVIVSPFVQPGTVDHTPYDHSSVLAMIERMWGLPPLTQRDANANDPGHLLQSGLRNASAPVVLNAPRPPLKAAKAPQTDAERSSILAQKLPEKGNLAGTLAILRKTEGELGQDTPETIRGRADTLRTRGDAKVYADTILSKVNALKQQRRIARLGRRI